LKFKISLRALFVLFLAASLPLAWLGNYRQAILREHQQAAILESYGDKVTRRSSTEGYRWWQGDRVVKVECAELRSLDEDSWRALESFAELEELDLSFTQVTDEDLARVARCQNLSACHLAGTGVTDQGLAHLERLPKLAKLDLKYLSLVGDATLAWLGRSQVKELSLAGCSSVSWEGLKELTKSRVIEELDLSNSTPNNFEPHDEWSQRELAQILNQSTSLRRVWLLKVLDYDADDDCIPAHNVEDLKILITLPGPIPRIVYPGREVGKP
jgi:hypothetical protein